MSRNPAPASLAALVDAIFARDGKLATSVPGYERREGQQQMAAAVAALIEDGGTLLAEAGTGTGKTLAYLVPAILSGQRLLISTGTKNLQEQIFLKDVPALQEALGIPFTATLMKGRGNYLCLHRWQVYRDNVEGNTASGGRLIDSGDRVLLPVIDEWLERTETGDRAELADLPEDLPVWSELSAEASSCLGTECPRYNDCFVTLMRQRAAESDVVIVNHHLLCADAAVRQSAYGEVIPASPALVIDEAHQLEDVATQYFGVAVSNFRIDDLLRDTTRQLASRPPGSSDGSTVSAQFTPAQVNRISQASAWLSDCARTFFDGIGQGRASTASETRVRYTAETLAPHAEAGMDVAGALDRLEAAMTPAAAAPAGSPDFEDEAVAAIRRRATEMSQDLRRLLRADDPDYVFFLEARGRGVVLRAAPINVAHIVRDTLLDRFRSVLLTSATLTVDRSFEYIRRRLGVQRPRELQVASEFDYTTQALLYLPRRMPPPKAPAFAAAAAREAIEILKRSRGRAFVLFTSYAVLRSVEPLLRMALTFPMLVQGTAPRSRLIEEFRRTPNAVLLGTSSFWQGVDVVGEALSCVIVDKLPFASPGDPVTAARIDAVRTAGGDAFADYQVPLAILTLQQGLGRLLRHRTDRGVLAILDPRLRTMGYGRRFLTSLPPAPVTHELDAVERFFK
ncbi:MAG TPA: helicase C-terminal domain-containing protein [Vicinamibacterales bacterium]|nr:helicase C-terminal domain-containing protein [Vicinamibacterales bacterium]